MSYRKRKNILRLENVVMFPFIVLGKLCGYIFPLKTRHNVFLFFPNADIGGSPRVNIDIIECVKDAKPLIIFSKKPTNDGFKKEFYTAGGRIIDLHKYIDNKALHFINFFFRGVIATWINRSENPVIFGGECIFFYKMVSHVNKNVKKVELCHLDTWLPYSIGLIDKIDLRIFSTLKLKERVIAQYEENNVPRIFYDKLLFIDNAIDIPSYAKTVNAKLEIVFIGRGSPQKRVHLIAAIAQKMNEAGDNAHFSFVGDVEKIIHIEDYPYCTFYGNVNDNNLMNAIYSKSDVLILTSAFEGLPMVVMTMMAYGKIVLSTAVNGIPDYIKHMDNGLLMFETDENKIVEEGVQLLRQLINEPSLKEQLGLKNRAIAIEKFSRQSFCKTYRQILLSE